MGDEDGRREKVGRREPGYRRRETGDERRETGRRKAGDGRREPVGVRRETGGGRRETRDGRRKTGDRRRETADVVRGNKVGPTNLLKCRNKAMSQHICVASPENAAIFNTSRHRVTRWIFAFASMTR